MELLILGLVVIFQGVFGFNQLFFVVGSSFRRIQRGLFLIIIIINEIKGTYPCEVEPINPVVVFSFLFLGG